MARQAFVSNTTQEHAVMPPINPTALHPALAASARPGRRQGFSLVETMVVVSIMAILMATAVPSFQRLQEARRLEGHAAELATDIQHIRSEAVAKNRQMHLRFGSDAAGTCYLLHSGNTGGCTCTSAGTAQCTDPMNAPIKSVGLATTQGVRLQANVSTMLFDPVRGTTTPAGSINLIADSGKTIRHVVNIMGRTRTCSPQGSMTGYATC
jgi:type IV fimbrial biogenesis protein FimT